MTNPTFSRRTAPQQRWLLVAAPLTFALAIRYWIGGAPVFPTDDAYISLHSARHLLEPFDPSFHGVRPLLGATSPVHILCLKALMVAGVDPLWAVESVNWIAASLYFAAVADAVSRKVVGALDQWAVMAVGVLFGFVPMQLANGQETGIAMAAVAWALNWLDTDTDAAWRLPVLAGVLPAIRPDLAIVTVAIASHRATAAPAHLRRDVSTVVVLSVAWMVVNLRATGYFIPNTVAAKREFFAVYSVPVLIKLQMASARMAAFLSAAGPALMIGAAFAITARSSRLLLASFAVTLLAIGWTASITLNHNFFRYLHPVVSAVVVGGFCAMGQLKKDRPMVRLVWPISLAMSLLWIGLQLPARWQVYRGGQELVRAEREISHWLNQHAAPGSVVLVHDAGYLSEFTNLPLVDLVGLKNPAATALHARHTAPSAGSRRGSATHRVACAAGAQYFVGLSDWDRAFGIADDLRRFGWLLTPIVRAPKSEPFGYGAYTLYSVARSRRC